MILLNIEFLQDDAACHGLIAQEAKRRRGRSPRLLALARDRMLLESYRLTCNDINEMVQWAHTLCVLMTSPAVVIFNAIASLAQQRTTGRPEVSRNIDFDSHQLLRSPDPVLPRLLPFTL
jgi:hypothetical protein